MRILFLLLFAIIYSFGCLENSNSPNSKTIVKILFIGNSLTYTNDLPKLVRLKAKENGVIIKTKIIAKPNYAIVDHLSEGSIQKELQSKEYDFIIIQQGPSSQAEGRELLIESGKKINSLIKNTKTRLVYFMVWPSLNYYQSFSGVIKNHQDAARLNNTILCPVGEVWKAHFDATNNFDYYSPDGFHPSLKGSKVAAKVIVKTLFK